jgi:hypothetical protein
VLCCAVQAANEKLARTTAFLEEEKARAEALLYRMSGLIACFPGGNHGAAGADGMRQQDGKQALQVQMSQQQQSQSVFSLLESTMATHSARQLPQQQLSTMSMATDKQSTALGESGSHYVRRVLWGGSCSLTAVPPCSCVLLCSGSWQSVLRCVMAFPSLQHMCATLQLLPAHA